MLRLSIKILDHLGTVTWYERNPKDKADVVIQCNTKGKEKNCSEMGKSQGNPRIAQLPEQK